MRWALPLLLLPLLWPPPQIGYDLRGILVKLPWCTLSCEAAHLIPINSVLRLVAGLCFLRSPSHAQRPSRTRLRASGATQTVLDALKEFDGKFQEPFDLLGLDDPECPKTDIRAAFRKVARVEHPDVSEREDAEERC
ncbi:unnamed protein product [Durusdinium trenchii]|uniref:J domain-containing protein n=1 Tax=Durusdinium trenchii TaxID=1381693 RepID=A0ABP0RX21_9DINO